MNPAPPRTGLEWLLDRYWLIAACILALSLPFLIVLGHRPDVLAVAAFAVLTIASRRLARGGRSRAATLHLVCLFPYWTAYILLPDGIPHRLGVGVTEHVVLLVFPAMTLVALHGRVGAAAVAALGALSILPVWAGLPQRLAGLFVLSLAILLGLVFRRLVEHLRSTVLRSNLLEATASAANEARTVDEAARAALEAVRSTLGRVGRVLAADGRCLARTDEAAPLDEDAVAIAVAAAREAGRPVVREGLAAVADAGLRLALVVDEPAAEGSTEVGVLARVADQLAVALGRIEAGADLRRARDEYRRLFEGCHDALLVFDPETERVLAVNQRACEVYGFERDELIGMSLLSISVDRERGRARIAEVLAAEGAVAFETTQFDRRGRRREFSIIASRIEYQGRPAILTQNRDVTEQRALESHVRETQKMEAMGQLAGAVAHDFNNLLTVIIGYSTIARNRPAESVAHLQEIQKAAHRGASLTRQLLAFTRRDVIQERPLKLNQVIGEMERMIGRLVGPGIEIVLDLDDALGNVLADPGQIEQVVLNLALNAADAMAGGGRLTIRTANEGPAHVALEVADSGAGIEPEVLARIFEPFFTTKEKGRGTGLGLATVHSIVERSGGRLEAESKPGQGSCFRIVWPRVHRPTERYQVRPAEPRRGTERLLLADDDEVVRDLSATILSGLGYRVETVADGDQAMAYLDHHSDEIDLVVSDVQMPGRTGIEIFDELERRASGMPVLLLSGFPEHVVDVEMRRAAYLAKPFTPDQLGLAVRTILDRVAAAD